MHRPLVLLLVAVVLLGAACGGSGSEATSPEGEPTAPATATSGPAQTGSGDVRVTFEAVCRIDFNGRGEIDIRYSARVEGTANLTRVRLIVNGVEVEDSGPISQKEFRRIATIPGQAGQSYTYQVVADAPGAHSPRVQSIVQCPLPPTPSGPRA